MRADAPLPPLLLTLAVLVSGCLAEPDPPGGVGDAGDASAATAMDEGIAFVDCVQFHTVFTARAADFAVPPGFTVEADEAGLTRLFLTPSVCPERATLIISVPIAPPSDRILEEHDPHYVVEWYADGPTAAWLDERGVRADGCGCRLESSGLPTPTFHMAGGGHAYTARFLLVPNTGPFTERPIAYFTGDGDARVAQSAGNGTNLGLGDVVVQHEGPGGAPPLALGNMAHAVHGMSFSWEVR